VQRSVRQLFPDITMISFVYFIVGQLVGFIAVKTLLYMQNKYYAEHIHTNSETSANVVVRRVNENDMHTETTALSSSSRRIFPNQIMRVDVENVHDPNFKYKKVTTIVTESLKKVSCGTLWVKGTFQNNPTSFMYTRKKQKVQEGEEYCIICEERIQNAQLMPCNHICLCLECTVELIGRNIEHKVQCPMCRSDFSAFCLLDRQ